MSWGDESDTLDTPTNDIHLVVSTRCALGQILKLRISVLTNHTHPYHESLWFRQIIVAKHLLGTCPSKTVHKDSGA